MISGWKPAYSALKCLAAAWPGLMLLKREAVLARELGFTGKGSIHPKQIPILNEVFTPDEATVKGTSDQN